MSPSRDQSPSATARTEKEPLAHTPGPWVTEFRLGERTMVVTDTEGRVPVALTAILPRSDFLDRRDEANARLIAAAPDLLEALKACRSVLDELLGDTDPYDDDWRLDACQAASAAIAKATGDAS